MTLAVNIAQSGSNNQTFRNRIINGAMVIDQRNNGASVTPTNGTNTWIVDRFPVFVNQASKVTAQRNAGSVTPPAGFTNYLGITSSSAYSPLSGDLFLVGQAIEGLNVADLAWGTASAQPITISFWVRSSLTGTFGGSVTNQAQDRNYVFSYTISSANTWEYKTATIPGDTTGTWLTNNDVGLRLYFNLGSGSSWTGAAGSWGSGLKTAPTGSVNMVSTNGATFYITGVQLEEGTAASPFEFRQYGTELALCQRYTQFNTAAYGRASGAGGNGAFFIPMMVQMRSTPTVTLFNGVDRVEQLYVTKRTATSITSSSWGNDTAGTAMSVELAVTSLGGGADAGLFGGSLLMSSEL